MTKFKQVTEFENLSKVPKLMLSIFLRNFSIAKTINFWNPFFCYYTSGTSNHRKPRIDYANQNASLQCCERSERFVYSFLVIFIHNKHQLLKKKKKIFVVNYLWLDSNFFNDLPLHWPAWMHCIVVPPVTHLMEQVSRVRTRFTFQQILAIETTQYLFGTDFSLVMWFIVSGKTPSSNCYEFLTLKKISIIIIFGCLQGLRRLLASLEKYKKYAKSIFSDFLDFFIFFSLQMMTMHH